MSGTITISEKYVRKYDQQSAGRATLVQQTTTTDLTSEQIEKLNTAYDERRQWDGGATNLAEATGRASLNVLEAGTAGGQIRTNTQLDDRYGQLIEPNTWDANNTFEGDIITDQSKIRLGYLAGDVITNQSYAYIYNTGGSGAAYPHNAFGNLVLQPRSSAARDIVFMTGSTTPSVAMIIDSSQGVAVKANLGTDNFASETTGWRATYAGHLDMRSIFTDRLIAKAFIADLDLALLSGHMVTKSVTQVSQDFTVPATASTGTLYVEALPGFPTSQVFEDNDWIRLQVVDRSGGGLIWAPVWATVNTGTFNDEGGGEQSYTITIEDDGGASGSKVNAGAAAQDFGQSGDGYIQQEAGYAGTSDRPWLQIATWATDPSVGGNITVRARLGRLTGITDAAFGGALSGHGLYSNNVYLKGKIIVESGSDISAVDAAWPSDASIEAYWAFDEIDGDVAYDNLGNGNNGTLVGGVTRIDGVSGGGLEFNGVDGVVNIGNPSELQMAGDFTIACWVYNHDTVTDGGGLFQKKTANAFTNTAYGFVRRDPDSVNFTVTDGTNQRNVTATATQDTWQFWVGVYIAAEKRVSIYRDGLLISSATNTSLGNISTTGNVTVGGDWYSDGATPYFDGVIDEPRIYSRALSEQEIRGLYKFIAQANVANANNATRTTIEGGVVTSGRIVLKDGDDNEKAGICGAGTGTAASIWSGASYNDILTDPHNADFHVNYNGKMFSTAGNIAGWEHDATSIYKELGAILDEKVVISSADRVIKFQYKPTGYDDWFLPSKDELEKMHDNLQAHAVGDFGDVYYWSSSEDSATHAWSHHFSLDLQVSTLKDFASARVRPARKFTTTDSYNLRDTGPAGGLIFHIIDEGGGSYTYYEALEEDIDTAPYWSNIDDSAITTTGTAIGTGDSNTTDIIAQTGHEHSAALWCDQLGDYEDRIKFTPDKIPALSYLVETGIPETSIGRDGFYSFSDGNNYFYINPNDEWYNYMIQSRGGIYLESRNQEQIIEVSDSFLSLTGKSVLLSEKLGATNFVEMILEADEMKLNTYGTGKITMLGIPEGQTGTVDRQIYKKWDGSDMILCIKD